MTFEEAIRKSIRKYRDNKAFSELSKAKGGQLRYNLEFFDDLEKELLKEATGSKKKKSEKIDG